MLPSRLPSSWSRPVVFWSSVCTRARGWCGTWRAWEAPSWGTACPWTGSRPLRCTAPLSCWSYWPGSRSPRPACRVWTGSPSSRSSSTRSPPSHYNTPQPQQPDDPRRKNRYLQDVCRQKKTTIEITSNYLADDN